MNNSSDVRRIVKRIRLKQRQKEIFIDVSRKLLSGLLFGTAFTVAMLRPSALHDLIKAYLKDKEKLSAEDSEIIYEKLRKDRFVEIVRKKDKYYLGITGKGKRQLVEYSIDTIKIRKQKWDGKWRMVAFDIPESLRLGRDVLRKKIKDIGFIKIQKSVWVSPYECADEINLICATYDVSEFVTYAEIEKIDIDKFLREKFKL